jgi:hypothetical protein
MVIRISAKKALIVLTTIIFLLVLASIIGSIGKNYFDLYGYRIFKFFYIMFNLDEEKNIPTLYSASALFTSSILLFIIAAKYKSINSSYIPWFGLGIIFLFLSLDEVATIHEMFNIPIQNALHTSGALSFAWVIPYALIVIAFGILYLRFLLKLPRKTLILFLVSGAIFISGALLLEMAGAVFYEKYGDNNLYYIIFYTIEECMEMLGIALFIYALISYINDQFNCLTIITEE